MATDDLDDLDDLDDIVEHYEAGREEERLTGGLASLELVRTRDVLRRHLPPPPALVVDVGGGTGVHADWLLADGYDVHLLDVTPRHVDLARRHLGARGLTADVADARRLPLRAASADVVLLLGPLYHLVTAHDRTAALREATRVVRPGGLIAAAAVSRFASAFDGLARDHVFEPGFAEVVRADVATGRHDNPTNRPEWFTTAYFHRPDELRDELTGAGLEVVDLVGVEGLAGWLPGLDRRWDDPADRALILEMTSLLEREPSILGLSAHLLAVARRPSRSRRAPTQ